MAITDTSDAEAVEEPGSGGMLGWIERVGNKVPNPSIMFAYLIGLVAVLSAILSWAGIKVTEDVAVPNPLRVLSESIDQLGGSIVLHDTETNTPVNLVNQPPYTIHHETVHIQNLLNGAGIAHMFSSFVDNFANFGPVSVVLIAMAGVGVAEHAGMMAALIHKMVKIAPTTFLTFIVIFVGVLSSVATDAGYLILVPLAASAFASVGRHPLAGMSAAFAGVGAIFTFNVIITPSDSMLTEITNEAIGTAGKHVEVTANYFFMIAGSFILAAVAALVSARLIERRLGKWTPAPGQEVPDALSEDFDHEAQSRGLRWALYGLIVSVVVVCGLTFPPGAPLRDPVTGAIIGPTPFMSSLIFIISAIFLVCGACYGFGAKTFKNKDDIITGITKSFSGLGGLLVMFLMIAQFIAYFNYTRMPQILAGAMANVLKTANFPALLLLFILILVFVLLDFIMPGLVPKWAIFAPIFIPLFLHLNIAPQTVQAAYRVGDAPVNVLTPLMVYLPFIVTIVHRYQKKAGIGTVIALMLPYAAILLAASTIMFVVWYVIGIPWGPGAPVHL